MNIIPLILNVRGNIMSNYFRIIIMLLSVLLITACGGATAVPEATAPPPTTAVAETEVEEIAANPTEPLATETAVPTATTVPTDTPAPTATIAPTDTPAPTAALEPTATPDITADFQTASGEFFAIQYPMNWLGDVQFGLGILGTSEEAQTTVFNEGIIHEGAVMVVVVEDRANTSFASGISVSEALSISLEDADGLTLSELDGPHEIIINGNPAATATGRAMPENGEPFYFVSTVVFQGEEWVARIGGFVAKAELVPTVQAVAQTLQFVGDGETAVQVEEFIAAELIRLGLPVGYDWETRAGARAGASGITGGRLALGSSEKVRTDNQADFDSITLEYAQGTNRLALEDDLLLVVWSETYERLGLINSSPILALTAVIGQSPVAITTIDEPVEAVIDDKFGALVTRTTTSIDGNPLLLKTLVIFSQNFATYATFYYPEATVDTWQPVVNSLIAELQILDE